MVAPLINEACASLKSEAAQARATQRQEPARNDERERGRLGDGSRCPAQAAGVDPSQRQPNVRSVAPQLVRPTPGISCERPIRSTLVCFIPLLAGLVSQRPYRSRTYVLLRLATFCIA